MNFFRKNGLTDRWLNKVQDVRTFSEKKRKKEKALSGTNYTHWQFKKKKSRKRRKDGREKMHVAISMQLAISWWKTNKAKSLYKASGGSCDDDVFTGHLQTSKVCSLCKRKRMRFWIVGK